MMIPNRQRGFSAVMVIVVIVLFSLIGAYLATLTSVSAISTAAGGSGIQAWFAARSGVELAVNKVLNGGCAGVSPTVNFSGSGLSGFRAAFSCSETLNIIEGPDTYDIYNIGVTATRGSPGQETYVSRSITVTVTDRDAPP